MTLVPLGLPSWERSRRAVDKVKNRLLRATAALEKAGVPYMVVGGNAVAVWVGRVDEGAVRYTQDVDLLISRCDLEVIRAALEAEGFVYRHVASLDIFLDGPDARPRDAVRLVFAGERVRPDHVMPAPEIAESEPSEAFRVVRLDALVRMKLTSFRDKDRTHLRDMIDVGLVDASWLPRLPEVLRPRLQVLLDTPDG
ncbi:nucleotidyl transferase AbiEii/AbiGii toxin family protein [Aquisphaera insulae]|uniref:nucleotidyl transferase AbiEii/AbiGii toxin family protein n=1 Tax=Aquisphaera insulae TaxID=2712864 RepID=UPI0013ED51F9|nr:nucleotidyl transferase AbiEii/AbiGii toxin family protein [Aquisphaera insulae]